MAVLTNPARLLFNRHLFCSASPVILYDLGVKGYHTPLTREPRYTPSIDDSRRLPVWILFAAQREKFDFHNLV